MQTDFDILIIGGGMVGATLATALQSLAYRVAVVEAHSADSKTQPSYDDRSTTLSYGSAHILDKIGLWSELAAQVSPIQQIQVSAQGYFGQTYLNAATERVPALGYILPNWVLGGVLRNRLQQMAANYYCPARLSDLSINPDHVSATIRYQDQLQTVTSKLLIAADGAQSIVRRLCQLPVQQNDYQQQAIVTNITPEWPHRQIAYERFTNKGPVAVLPLPNLPTGQPHCGVVWVTDPEQASQLQQLEDDSFLQQLHAVFGYRLGKLLAVGQRQLYPLSLIRSEQITHQRVVFVGNAAQAVHPVAGQGFNLGLRDVITLVEQLQQLAPLDPGDAGILAEYSRQRQADRRRVIRFTDSLVRLFSNDLPVWRSLRAKGLSLLEILPAAKHYFARRAMGL